MRHFATFLLGIALFIFTGCSSSSSDNPLTGGTTNGVLSTCVKGIPEGSKAVIRGANDTMNLVNGCFDFSTSKVAARAMSNENDTILVFNDTSLFALTIPFNMLGDTVQMVSTNLNLLNASNGQFDSILAVVFDKAHIHERAVKMKRAYTATKVQYHVSMYSPVNGGEYKIHYEFHKGDSVWISELITAERGAQFDNNVSDMDSGSIPKIDTSDFFTDLRKDTIHTVKAKSIYGVAKMYIDGIEKNTFKDSIRGIHKHTVKAIDSAGYVSNKEIYSFVGYDVSDKVISIENIPNENGGKTYILDIVFTPTYVNDTLYLKNDTYGISKNNIANVRNGHYVYSIGTMETGSMLLSSGNIPFIY